MLSMVGEKQTAQSGFSVIEALVTVSLLSILLGVTVIGLRGRFMDFSSATQQLLNDLRLARAHAITRGAHYRMTFQASEYRVDRLQDGDDDGLWEPSDDGTALPSVTSLPTGMTVSVEGNQGEGAGSDPCVEFDTRGMLVATGERVIAENVQILLEGAQANRRKTIQVWPSGQMGFVQDQVNQIIAGGS